MKTIIETKRLLIREINSDDIDCFLDIYTDSENLRFIPISDLNWSRKKLKEKYDKTNQDYKNGFGIYAAQIKNNSKIIGEVGLFNSFQDLNHLELGYILDKNFWRKGYGTEICNSLIHYDFNTLNLSKITARMFKQNVASIGLSEKCGMKLIQQKITDDGKYFCEYEITKDRYVSE